MLLLLHVILRQRISSIIAKQTLVAKSSALKGQSRATDLSRHKA